MAHAHHFFGVCMVFAIMAGQAGAADNKYMVRKCVSDCAQPSSYVPSSSDGGETCAAPAWSSPDAGDLGTMLVGLSVSEPLNASEITYSVVSGSLPPGISVSDGKIVGTPEGTDGAYNFTIRATNSAGTSDRSFSITVNGLPVWASPAAGSVGTFDYGTAITPVSLSATDLNTPVSYSVSSGALPTGVTVSGTAISGTPTASGTFNFTIKATDSTSQESIRVFSMAVNPPPDACIGSPTPGTVCADGSVYAGLSPDGNVKMYVTRCDAGMTWSGSACTGTQSILAWNNGTTNWTTTGMTSVTTGEANTTALAVLLDAGQPYQTARYCDNLELHGKTDWYLPATDELNVLYTNRATIGGFDLSGSAPSGYYWSSSEIHDDNALYQRFSDGYQDHPPSKAYGLPARCSRR